MFWTIVATLMLVAGILGLVFRKRIGPTPPVAGTTTRSGLVNYKRQKLIMRLATVGLVVLGAGLLVAYSVVQIPAKEVGIAVAFGNANEALDNGLHVVPPWTDIEIVDGTVQNINLTADLKRWTDEKVCTTVSVRLGNQTTACIDGTLQWNIEGGGHANTLWQNYHGDGNQNVVAVIGRNVVMRELQRALNNAFEHYNPLAILPSANGQIVNQVTTTSLSVDVERDMKVAVDSGIIVDKVLISFVHYDNETQKKLNGFAEALADTQIATQQKLTAEQQRLAAEELVKSSAIDSAGVQYRWCLDLVENLAAKNMLKDLPPAFTCGGQSAADILIQAGSR